MNVLFNVQRNDIFAGDTFTGYFISCLAQKMPAGEILRLASVASSIAVSRKGAAPSIPYFAEVSASTIEPVPPSAA